MLRPLLLLGVLAAGFAMAAESPPVSLPAPAHPHAEETANIRKQHLKRLDERINAEPGELREKCRYESEIPTHPPARQVVLSFDDGPDPEQTEFILGILDKYKISATFFLIGQKALQHPGLVAKIRAAGRHTIGNHSWDHPNFHDIGVPEQADEVEKTEHLLGDIGSLKLFRYPYGNSTCETNELLHQHGYRIVGWHIDSCDWAFDKNGSVDAKEALSCGVLAPNRSDFVDHVVSTVRAHNGGIVLMHEIHPNTLAKLDEIIVRLLNEGFVFGTIEDKDFESSFR